MAARRASSISRGILVALGCISAVWMIFVNGNAIVNDCKEFFSSSSYSFFEYFFSYRLANFSALFLGLSFFAIIIRDLWGLKKPILWILLVLTVLCIAAMLINLLFPISQFSSKSFYYLFKSISVILMMLAYCIYAILGINNRRYHPFGFFFGIFSALLVFIGEILQICSAYSEPTISLFIPGALLVAANVIVFKCTLYER